MEKSSQTYPENRHVVKLRGYLESLSCDITDAIGFLEARADCCEECQADIDAAIEILRGFALD